MRKWLKELMRQWRCLLGRHSPIVERGSGELFLRCTDCWARTPGWQLSGAGPVLTYPGDPARHRMTYPVTVEPYDYRGAAVIVGSMDDDTAALVLALDLAGRQDDLKLLLQPSGSDKVQ